MGNKTNGFSRQPHFRLASRFGQHATRLALVINDLAAFLTRI
jgi:hypothetical protein